MFTLEIWPSPSRSYIRKENMSLSLLVFSFSLPCLLEIGLKWASTWTKSWKWGPYYQLHLLWVAYECICPAWNCSFCVSLTVWFSEKKAWMILSPRGLTLSSGRESRSSLSRNPFLLRSSLSNLQPDTGNTAHAGEDSGGWPGVEAGQLTHTEPGVLAEAADLPRAQPLLDGAGVAHVEEVRDQGCLSLVVLLVRSCGGFSKCPRVSRER